MRRRSIPAAGSSVGFQHRDAQRDDDGAGRVRAAARPDRFQSNRGNRRRRLQRRRPDRFGVCADRGSTFVRLSLGNGTLNTGVTLTGATSSALAVADVCASPQDRLRGSGPFRASAGFRTSEWRPKRESNRQAAQRMNQLPARSADERKPLLLKMWIEPEGLVHVPLAHRDERHGIDQAQ